MPGGFPGISLDYCNAQDIGGSLSTMGTPVAGGSGAYGSWVQLTAATLYDADHVSLYATGNTTGGMCYCDIGVGSAGNEVVIASTLMVFNHSAKYCVYSYELPLSIPAGSRVCARIANSSGTASTNVKLNLFSGAFASSPACSAIYTNNITIGAGGTQLTTGGAATKGSYVTIDASTARDYCGIMPKFAYCSVADWYMCDVAIGAAGNENVIIPNIGVSPPSVSGFYELRNTIYWVNIPAGSRISARASASATAAATIYAYFHSLQK